MSEQDSGVPVGCSTVVLPDNMINQFRSSWAYGNGYLVDTGEIKRFLELNPVEPVAEIGPGTWVSPSKQSDLKAYVIRTVVAGSSGMHYMLGRTEFIDDDLESWVRCDAPDADEVAAVYRALDGKECERCGGNGLECVPCGGVGVFPPVVGPEGNERS